MVINIVDGGGGSKICDEAEGEGAVGGNDDDIVGIDGGAIHSFHFVQICKILGVDSAVLSTN